MDMCLATHNFFLQWMFPIPYLAMENTSYHQCKFSTYSVELCETWGPLPIIGDRTWKRSNSVYRLSNLFSFKIFLCVFSCSVNCPYLMWMLNTWVQITKERRRIIPTKHMELCEHPLRVMPASSRVEEWEQNAKFLYSIFLLVCLQQRYPSISFRPPSAPMGAPHCPMGVPDRHLWLVPPR